MSDSLADPTSPLTADLLQALIADAGPLAAEAHRLLAPVARRRNALRERLLAEGQILTYPHRAAGLLPQHSIAAVDGGSVREHLYAADLMVAVAASAEGMTSTGGHPLAQRHWTKVREHESENDRLLSAAMASLELVLINDLTHDLRILDGSHGTPVIALSTALSARSAGVAEAAAALVTDEVVAALRALSDPDQRDNPGEVVALPKADSSHAFADIFRQRYDLDLPGGDRFIAAQVLAPGEMLHPRAAKELTGVHFTVSDDAPHQVRQAAARLDHAVTPLRESAADTEIAVTYVKPTSADTVLKVEYRASESLPAHPDARAVAVTEGQRLAGILSAETPGPYLQEPFAQYAVDLAAKSVAVGAEALNQAMIANLPEGSEDYLMLLARAYRTKSSGGRSGGRPGGATGRPGGR